MAIQLRRGNQADLDATRLQPGEIAVCLDTGKVIVKLTGGNYLTLADAVTLETALSGKADASHTHSYAGSSSAGGAATSADKLNTNAGSGLVPIYFSNGVPVASKGNSIPFVVGTGSTAGTWLGTLDGVTAYYDGLMILYKPSVAGASTTTLNLNGLGAKTCYTNNSTRLSTQYPVNQPVLLAYSASQNSGCWMCVDNYVGSNTIPQAICDNNATTAAKTASMTNYTATAKTYVMVNIKNANTSAAALSMNINGQGAKPIYINGTASSATNYTLPAGSYLVYYDGTNYYFNTDGRIYGLGLAAYKNIEVKTQAQYDALATPDADTIYLITEASS